MGGGVYTTGWLTKEGIWVHTREYKVLQDPNTPSMLNVVCCFTDIPKTKLHKIYIC